ncbi:MAG: hypothetical protein FWE22_08445 [Firmicutes bacterium]|nr:hypothetical protein [Bacillota bacterium]
MDCKYCFNDMEHDETSGVWENEVHFFFCLCGISVCVYEDGRESVWGE